MRSIALLALLCTALCGTPCRAWNDFGHMTVAALAYARLDPVTRARCAVLLRLNPDYAAWVRDVPLSQRDEVAFLKASTWADAIKHSRTYRNDGEQAGGPGADRNIGYRDRLQHRYWHFIDVPLSADGVRGPLPRSPNIQTQIGRFRRTLASPRASEELKSYDLVWLLHLVGDAHQPLHAVSRFTRAQPAGDAGGNRLPVCESPCRRSLHVFWDDVLGTSRHPQAARRLAATLPEPGDSLSRMQDEASWIRESAEIARDDVYVAPIGTGPGPYALTSEYRERARAIARERIALAGARLARLLNSTLH